MRADPLEPRILVFLSSHDNGVPLGNKNFLCTCFHVMTVGCCGTKNSCATVIMGLGWMLWNKNFLVHPWSHDGRCLLWKKVLVDQSSYDECGCCGTKNSCAPVIMWWPWTSWEQKVLVHLSSHDEGGCRGTKNTFVHLSSRDEVGCCGTKNSCGPVITWWRRTSWEHKILVHLSSCD